jgi:nitroreductase
MVRRRKNRTLGGLIVTSEQAHETLAAILRGRRSIDLFEAGQVSGDELRRAIELARWAPNHRLTEPWRFYLIGPKTMRAIIELAAELDTAAKGERVGEARRARWGAIPGFFALTSLRDDDELTDRENYAACCCAAQNLMLYLWSCGIGVKWTTGAVTREPRFRELVGIDSSRETLVGLFFYGRPKVVPQQKRRPVEDIVTQVE